MLHDPGFDLLYHAPVLVLISSTAAQDWAIINCALAAENLMLAACAEGLGTCWIGLAQPWLETAQARRALGLPDVYRPVAPIVIGHAKEEPQWVGRKPAEIHWIG